jgi:hypothetical protein
MEVDELTWKMAVDQKSGRRYYYDTKSGETTWAKPVELAAGEEREEILRKREETRSFFSDMERNMRLKVTDSTGATAEAKIVEGGSSSSSSSSGKGGRRRERDIGQGGRAQSKSIDDYDFHFDIEQKDSLPSRDRGGMSPYPFLTSSASSMATTPSRGRIVRTISSLDDDIMNMGCSSAHNMARNISRGNLAGMASDDFIVGIGVSPGSSDMRYGSPIDSAMAGLTLNSGNGNGNGSGNGNMRCRGGSLGNQPKPSRRATVTGAGSGANAGGFLRRNNSMSTIFVEETLEQPHHERTIKCVCAVLRLHMLEACNSKAATSSDYDVFRDASSYPDVSSPSKAKFDAVASDISDGCRVIPSLEIITSFFSLVFFKTQMETECIIIALIYCERLLKITRGRLHIDDSNWRSVIFASLIMASKVWDDLSMWNVDFSNVFASSFNLRRINELEMAMLNALKYFVKVTAGEYAKYYFHLRSMMARLGYHSNEGGEAGILMPLDVSSAQKLQLSTQRYQESAAPIRRTMSAADMTKMSIQKRKSAEEEGLGLTVFTERSALVGVEQIMSARKRG